MHAADLHLDSPFSGLRHLPENVWKMIRNSTFVSLNRLVNTAILEKVDFVLFSGDIYDIEDRSVKAQARFKKEMQRLEQAEIPVFIIHGNHDFVSDASLHLKLPENVTVFKTSIETHQIKVRTGEQVAVSGFSYGKRWVHERMVSQYPNRLPNVDMHIGLLHGFQEGQTNEHADYAPFSVGELQEKRYDYWALGHIHTYQKAADYPLVYYSGNTQGRHKNEMGEKGFLLVDWTTDRNSVTFIPSAPIIWQTLVIDASNTQSLNSIFKKIEDTIPHSANQSYLISIQIILSDKTSGPIRKKIMQEDFKEALQRIETDSFTWIVTLTVVEADTHEKIPALEQLFPDSWQQAISDVKEEKTFNELTNDFFHQTRQAALLDERTEIYRNAIVNRAINKILQVTDFQGEKDNEN